MASLGLRTINEMVGRADLLETRKAIDHWKARGLDFSKILTPAEIVYEGTQVYRTISQDHGLDKALDNELIELAQPALLRGEKVRIEHPIININRVVGTMLSHEVAKATEGKLLPDDTIHIKLTGTAGQSLGAWLAKGITLEVEGDCNDYVGKGLSGGKIIVYPPKSSTFKAEDNILIGNVVMYGATSGECLLPRHRRRALLRAQQRRYRGRRRHWRSRLRIHDRRARGRAGQDGPQLRRRHERRHRLRVEQGRQLRAHVQHRDV